MSLGDLTLKEGQELAKSFFSMSALLCFLFGIIWLIGSGAEFGFQIGFLSENPRFREE